MGISGGYVLQPRKVDESDIAHCPPHVREIWFYLIRRANHKDKRVNGKLIKRGQVFTSYAEIIRDLTWYVGFRRESYKKHHCETAIETYKKQTMATTTKTTRGFIITILNYDYYQSPANYETDSETDHDFRMKATMNRHDKQECKETKKKENNTYIGKKSASKKRFVPPTEKEMVDYFVQNGFPAALGQKAFRYYAEANPPWTDSKGKPVRSWQQKVIANWFLDSNKLQQPARPAPKYFDSSNPKDLEDLYRDSDE